MFDNNNQHSMMNLEITHGGSPLDIPSQINDGKVALKNIKTEPDYATLKRLNPTFLDPNDKTYIPGHFQIFLDGEFIRNFIKETIDSNSLMEQYTEAVAKICEYFETRRGAKCRFVIGKKNVRFIDVSIKNKLVTGGARTLSSYSSADLMYDLKELKRLVSEERRTGFNYVSIKEIGEVTV